MPKIKTKPMATFYVPGSFMSEDYAIELPERSVEAALRLAPKHAFCFVLWDQPVVDIEYDAERFKVVPVAQNKTGRYYIGGEVFTPAELRALDGDRPKGTGAYDTPHGVLIANAKSNGWERLIKCRTGNWQPFTDEDEIVEPLPTSPTEA